MLEQRLVTAAVLGPLVAAGVFFLSSVQLGLVLALFVAAGAWEWAWLAGVRSAPGRSAYVVLVLSLAGLTGWWVLSHARPVGGLLGAALAWWMLALAWECRVSAGSRGRLMAVAKAAAGVLVLVPAWTALVALHARVENGHYLVLFLLGLIWVADSGAFFVGRRFGRIKLAPHLSPGKTREGVYGALAAAGLFALGGGALLDMRGTALAAFVALCLVTVLFSVVGDLFESLMKRQAGVKDSGVLLPGHGGVLDRVDSLTAAAPVFVLGLRWVSLIP